MSQDIPPPVPPPQQPHERLEYLAPPYHARRRISWPQFWAGVFFGLAISVASTVVLTRVLSDNGQLHTATGHIAIGWLVVEDLFTVLALVILPAVFSPDALGGDVLLTIAQRANVKIEKFGDATGTFSEA